MEARPPAGVTAKTGKAQKMKKALIIFGTTTGNTEAMADMVKQTLEEKGLETQVKNVTEADVEDLSAGYDLLVLGCPAYGDDQVELQEDFADFYERLDGISLNNCNVAVFAPGDSSYEHFCGSVDMLEEKMTELGGHLVAQGLKVDGDPDDSQNEIRAWAGSIASFLF